MLIYLFSGMWTEWRIPLVVMVTHFFIDWWKLRQKDGARSFLIDQCLHVLVLFLLWLLATNGWAAAGMWLQDLLQYRDFWIIVTGYAIAIWPMAFLLGFATKRWREKITDNRINTKVSLSEAGRWIGIFERTLVLTFIISDHFEGIGFLIAAKSILRFNDLKDSESRQETEYILIGTLMSFSASIFIGMVVSKLL